MTVAVRPETGVGSAPPPATQLAKRVAQLRRRSADGGLDRGLLIVGGVLLPLGLLLIVVGWLGAAHTVLLFEQIPYLISGGLLGLALVVAGGFVYFGYWQTLLVREGRDQHRELIASLGRIEQLLGGAERGTEVGHPTGHAESRVDPLLATPTGTMIHRASCSVVAGRAGLRPVAMGTPGFEPCRICRPFD